MTLSKHSGPHIRWRMLKFFMAEPARRTSVMRCRNTIPRILWRARRKVARRAAIVLRTSASERVVSSKPGVSMRWMRRLGGSWAVQQDVSTVSVYRQRLDSCPRISDCDGAMPPGDWHPVCEILLYCRQDGRIWDVVAAGCKTVHMVSCCEAEIMSPLRPDITPWRRCCPKGGLVAMHRRYAESPLATY